MADGNEWIREAIEDNRHGFTLEEVGAVFSEAAQGDDEFRALAEIADVLFRLLGGALPVPETPWERDALLESARRKARAG